MRRTVTGSSIPFRRPQEKDDLAEASASRTVAPPVVLFLVLLDLICNLRVELSFTGWIFGDLAIAGLLALSAFYAFIRFNRALAELSFYAALWVCFSLAGVIATYLAAAADRPLCDASFAAFDTAIGFQWSAWADLVRAHPLLHLVLALSYRSLSFQVAGSLCLFALSDLRGRSDELLATAGAALLLTVPLSAFLPALGPWVHYAYPPADPDSTAYVAHVLALRQGHPTLFVLADMQGVVCCPSYHTVLALLFVYAHRGLRWSMPVVLVLNGLMLLSIPSEGGHYLADMGCGGLVALVSIGLVRVVRLVVRPRTTGSVPSLA